MEKCKFETDIFNDGASSNTLKILLERGHSGLSNGIPGTLELQPPLVVIRGQS